VTKNVLEFRPPSSARTEIVREGNHDPVGGDVRSGGDAGLGVTDRVGELLEGVFLKVVVVAALFSVQKQGKSQLCSTAKGGREAHLEVRNDDKVRLVDRSSLVTERLDEVVVSHERQRRLVDIVAHRALHVVVD
jgi:hypothetical protein